MSEDYGTKKQRWKCDHCTNGKEDCILVVWYSEINTAPQCCPYGGSDAETNWREIDAD